MLFIHEINPPPPQQIELLPAIADTGNEIQIPYQPPSFRHPADYARSLVSVSILGNGRLREFLMRVDINAQWEKEERAIITKLDKFDAWPGLDCIYVTNKLSLLQAPSAGSRAAGAQYWRGDCRTSGAGARGQHPGNENNQEATPGLQLRQLQ